MDLYTSSGHVIGMLDRDQRTAKSPLLYEKVFVMKFANDKNKRETTWTLPNRLGISHHIYPGLLGRTSPHSPSKTRRIGRTWKSLQSVHQVKFLALTLVYYAALCSLLPCIVAAPFDRKAMSRMESTGKWVNPCGYRDDHGAVYDMNSEMQQVSDSELLTHIIDQANIASTNAVDFKEKFARRIFHMGPNELQSSRKDIHYNWLPSFQEVPKSLGERVPTVHLDSLELDQALLDTYEYLQKVAVGLEQTVWDQEDTQGEFLTEFLDAENNLRNLLCELQMAIHERNLKMRKDISREIMPPEFRDTTDNTNMNTRHWLIYRDYMNLLEYVKEVFKYLKETKI